MSVSFLGRWARLLTYQGIGAVLAFSTIALATYTLSPATYGQYGTFLSIVQITNAVALTWISQAALRFGREEFRETRTLTTTIVTALKIGGPVVLACLLLGWLASPHLRAFIGAPTSTLVLLAVGLVALAAFEGASYASQAADEFTGFTGGQLLAKSGLFLVLLAILAGAPEDPRILFAGTSIGWCMALILTAFAIRNYLKPPLRASRKLMRRMISYGYLLPIGAAAGMVVNWLGFWILRVEEGVATAGVYMLAYSTFALGAMALLPLGAVLTPGMLDVRLTSRQPEIVRRSGIIVSAAVALALLLPLALAIVQFLATSVLPDRYLLAAPVLTVLLTALPAQLITYSTSPLVQAYEHMVPRTVAINVIVALINVLGIYLLLPRLGIVGAGLAVSVAICFAAFGMLFLTGRLGGEAGLPTRLMGRLALPLCVLLASGLAISQLSASIGLAIGLATTALGMLTARAAGQFALLNELQPHITVLPDVLQPLAGRILRTFSGH